MAKKTIKIDTAGYSDFIIEKSNTRYILEEGDLLDFKEIRTDGASTISNIELMIDGVITGNGGALDIGKADSLSNKIVVGETGVLDATDAAIIAFGQKTVITNFGAIFTSEPSNSIGVQSEGDGGRILNAGYLKAETCIIVTGDGNTVKNDGQLATHMGGTGVVFDSATGDVNRLINRGYIDGSNAVEGGDGSERITNRGRIVGDLELGAGDDILTSFMGIGGDVSMGSGNDRVVIRGKGDFTQVYADAGDDVFDLRGAQAISSGTTIAGGMDDDTYIVTRNDLKLEELAGQGTDTVRSSVSFTLGAAFENLVLTGNKSIDGTGSAVANIIIGNGSANTLNGMSGADTLDGGGGNDVLTGGGQIDMFVFRTRTGKDRITDFTDASDKIDLSDYKGISAFEDLEGRISQNGTDAVITLKNGDRITLDNFDAGNLTMVDFQF